MATHDYVIDNSTGANVRADINNVLKAILTNNGGSTDPATVISSDAGSKAFSFWADTNSSPAVLKIRNAADNAWVELLQLDGTLTLEDGSASTPALAFRDDLDTGIFSGGANEFNIATGGSERFVINSSGNCGIGTTSPTATLHIQKSGTSQNLLTLESDLGTNNNRTLIIGGPTSDSGSEPFRFTTGNSLSFVIDSTERMRIDSSGKVGIGTSSPNNLLHLKTTSANGEALLKIDTYEPKIRLQDASGSSHSGEIKVNENALRFNVSVPVDDATDLTERMRINSSGNVGIGTASPDQTLHVFKGSAGSIASDGNAVITMENSNHCILQMLSPNNVSNRIMFGDPQDANIGEINYDHSIDAFTIKTNVDERVRIDSSGRFLIGSSSVRNIGGASAASGLQVEGTTGNASSISLVRNQNSTAGSFIRFGKTRGTSTGAVTTVADGDTLGALTFSGADGTDLENSTAQISAIVNGTVAGNQIPTDIIFETSASNTAGKAERVRIDSGGNVYIAATTIESGFGGVLFRPNNSEGILTQVFDRANSSNTGFAMSFENNNVGVGSIAYNNTATAYNTSSDYRLKENAVSISDGITRLKTLKPYRFNFIADTTKTVDGFFAHEVTAVPEAVTGTKDEVDSDNKPIYQGIDQSKLVPLLVAAVQELITKVETLEAA